MYKVLLVDDEALIRDAISVNMKWDDLGYELIGTCKNGKEAISFLNENEVDLVITDICMPFVDGLDLSKFIYESLLETKVIILSGYNEFEYAKSAVKYQVMEYVLKPVTMAELSEILIRIKSAIYEDKKKKESLKKLELAYKKNLPILRSRYCNQLMKGIHKEQTENEIQEKLAELDMETIGVNYKIAIASVWNGEEFLKVTPDAKWDLPSFILYNILEELTFHEVQIHGFQDINNDTVILLAGNNENELHLKLQEIYDNTEKLLSQYFDLKLTLGIGIKVNLLNSIYKSYESALSALEYRYLYGGARVLDIRDFGEMDRNTNIDISDSLKKLTLSVKINNRKDIETFLKEIIESLREHLLSPVRVQIYVQNILVAINNLLEYADLAEESNSKKQDEFLQMLYNKKTLEAVEGTLLSYCYTIGDLLSEQRDSFGKKQAIIAKEYIEENYSDEGLNLQTMCNDLSISMSYFSMIFKKYTGETFIEALTKKRMNMAMELLANTSMKVYEIAEKVGFSDPHYFTLTFKKYTGKTPKEYGKKEGK